MKLEIHQSWWAMTGLGNGTREWTLEEKFESIAEAGFSGILGQLPEPAEADTWRRLLDEYGFSFGVQAVPFPKLGDDLTPYFARAKAFGVQYVNAQILHPYLEGQPAADFVAGFIRQAAEAGLPFFVETHRGRITQDLRRTAQLVEALPQLRLTIDFSHYVVGEGMDRAVADETAEGYLQTLLTRASSIHARISNGHQVQVDVGEDASHPAVQPFLRWWRSGMANWRRTASAGDVFPFVCELGPPAYAITHGVSREEASDRWKQALVLKRLGEQAWAEA
ncbi:sugar phosphate isomerase/epimerase family protein [Paenibacillus ferrarius]|uniref:sugar phosphate isomerase/epimerase family protein n=1 Tax=Paenibacillus ferrarius TaxID=1469647 RepID=UPI003D2E2751